MKTFTTLTCAIVAAGAVAFCATSAKAVATYGVTTNYDELNISMTVTTPKVVTHIDNTKFVSTSTNAVYDNQKILELLSTSDFYGGDLTGYKLVVSWDAGDSVTNGHYGDILVIDKDGTVYYDATHGTYNGVDTNSMSVDFYDYYGANDEDYSDPANAAGHDTYHSLNVASFNLYDYGDYLNISAKGLAKVDFTQNWDKNHKYTTGSESERATVVSAGYNLTGVDSYQTVKVKITASGHSKGFDDFYYHYY